MYNCIHVNFPVFLPDSNETQIFPTDYLGIVEYQISWKSTQLETSSFMRTDGKTGGQTYMTKLTVAVSSFANALKIWSYKGTFFFFAQKLIRTELFWELLFVHVFSYCSSMYSYRCLRILIVVYVFLDAATLTEVFPCFFLSCKANSRV